MKRKAFSGISVFALLALFLGLGLGSTTSFDVTPAAAPSVSAGAGPAKRDFFFQVAGYRTRNQGSQTINLYFHYRYNEGITDADIPNYIDLRTKALKYLDGINTSKNPYWEVLVKPMCTQLKKGFPIEAISCQMQVLPDNRPGVPFEPGYHSAIYTIGDMEPLAVPGPTV
ncbi:hypothetical protein EES43_25510 [Streptomyces sp. ADI96-02]|uniref:hypothetical protein n=1 Tax=Streptomyces sp. ADI96-02 TaxID=1522760 RepID=UPI000F54EF37|nr:hypothetical protein [Streptomyces sp. ADI96-02]RPK55800.1 hypothetical protein EES43_25510 [Streptomyces sp. ADI96-02]